MSKVRDDLWAAIRDHNEAIGSGISGQERLRAACEVIDRIAYGCEDQIQDLKRQVALASEQLGAVACQLLRSPKIDPADHTDPRWSLALHGAWRAAQRHDEDAAQIAALRAKIAAMKMGKESVESLRTQLDAIERHMRDFTKKVTELQSEPEGVDQ